MGQRLDQAKGTETVLCRRTVGKLCGIHSDTDRAEQSWSRQRAGVRTVYDGIADLMVLYACGLGYHQLWINGRAIAPDDYMTPAYSSYHRRCYYTAHAEIQKCLCAGENIIGMVVAPGWRRNLGEYLKAAKDRRIAFMGDPQFTAVLDLQDGKGELMRIMTDESWCASRGPVIQTNIFQGEIYDAGKEIRHWSAPEMSAAEKLCVCTSAPAADVSMTLQKLEPVRVGKVYAPRSVSRPQPGVFVFDFGQNIAGVCQIKVPGDLPYGTQIKIRHAELLDENGMLYTDPLRTAAATDYYIAGMPDGRTHVWKPTFTYHGFRYAEVTGPDWVPDRDFICALALYNDVENRSTFRCGNGMVNQLQEAIVATELANIHNVPTDCPQRDERMFWLNDATVRFEEMPFNVETGRLLPRSLYLWHTAHRPGLLVFSGGGEAGISASGKCGVGPQGISGSARVESMSVAYGRKRHH